MSTDNDIDVSGTTQIDRPDLADSPISIPPAPPIPPDDFKPVYPADKNGAPDFSVKPELTFDFSIVDPDFSIIEPDFPIEPDFSVKPDFPVKPEVPVRLDLIFEPDFSIVDPDFSIIEPDFSVEPDTAFNL